MSVEPLSLPTTLPPTPRGGLGPSGSASTTWPLAGGPDGSRAALAEPFQQNRRSSPRYTAVRDHLWVGWWTDDEFVIVEANLVNISEGGVQVSLNPSPVQGQPVWMRLEGSFSPESLRAVVLESRWMRLKRRYSVRFRFETVCPAAFYETAVYGRTTNHVLS